MRPIPLLFALLAACGIDYDVKHNDGPSDGEDPEGHPGEDTSVAVTPGTCPDQSWDADTFPVDEACYYEPSVGTFTPIVEWRNDSIGGAYTTPVVGRIYDQNSDGLVDENDIPAVVVATTAGNLVAMAGDSGTVLWTVSGLGSEPMTPAIGDLTGDGRPEVVGSGASVTIAVRGNGTTLWTAAGSAAGYCGGVAIGDLDGDALPEVVLGSIILAGATGATRGTGAYGAGTGFPGYWAAATGVIADLDQDGVQEAVVGNAAYDANGNTLWNNGMSDGFVAVANFDSDPYGEMVVTDQGTMRLQDHDGSLLWRGNYSGSRIGPPTVADFDGDGGPEIGVAGEGSYQVVDADGTVLWSRETYDYSSGFTGSAVFDFEGDGAAEVVYADENNLYVYDGATGTIKLQEDEHSSATCSEYPSIADVDNDGHAEIIYTSSAYSGSENGVRVVGDADNSWQPGRPVWNQHAYSITNIEDDLSILADPESNWIAGYNNFRSGDVTPVTGSGDIDLGAEILDVCAEDCDDGKVTVWIGVGNGGMATSEESFNVEVLGDTDYGLVSLYNFEWTDPLASGVRSESVELNLSGVPAPLYGIVLEVNGDHAVGECSYDNNTATWDEVICP